MAKFVVAKIRATVAKVATVLGNLLHGSAMTLKQNDIQQNDIQQNDIQDNYIQVK